MDHVLPELSTMTRPSWVALHSMAPSFIELDKAVVHVIRLVGFPAHSFIELDKAAVHVVRLVGFL